jgi:hypothetical protein
VGFNEPSAALEFLVYPNPASGQVRINFASGAPTGLQLTITDMAGKVIVQAPVQQGQISAVIEIETLAPGIYFVQAMHGAQIVNKKLVVY